MPKLELKPETRNKLALISLLLNKAEAVFSTLAAVDDHAVLDFHNVEGSLTHCLRWGPQAAEELLKASKPKNASKRKFFRKIYLFDTLSESPLDGKLLEVAMADADTEGDVGDYDHDIGEIVLTGQDAVAALHAVGSEPGFFQLDDEGKDTDE